MVEEPQVDAEEAQLRDMGLQQDLMEGRPTSEGAQPPEPPAPPAKEVTSPPPSELEPPASPEPEPEQQELPEIAAQRERDEQGRFKAGEKQQQEAATPEKPKSKYAEAKEKGAKESERFDRSWSKFQQEKEQFRSQQAQWEEAQRVHQLQVQAQMPPLEKGGIDINGYRKAYLDFRQTGDFENAMRSLETVLELEQTGQQEVAKRQEAAYELAWRRDMEAQIQRDPNIADPGNPLAQEVDRIVNEHPYLFYIPQGFNKAVEIATLLLAAGSDSELREENEQLRAELERRNNSSQPAKGGPGRPPSAGPKGIDEMTDAEAERYLTDLSDQEDRMMRR